MLRRSAFAALGCRGCQAAAFRAVLTRPAPGYHGLASLIDRGQAFGPLLQTAVPGRRLQSTAAREEEPAEPLDENVDDLNDESPVDTSKGRPWFLDVDPPRHPPSQHIEDLPKVPEGAPSLLDPLIKYVYEDMGLDDLSMLDLREIDPPPALGPSLIMLFGTARSERHLHISAGRLARYIRKNFKADARADGMIGPGELRTKLRRLRKKAKLMGTNTAIVPGGDNGISTGWVCVNFFCPDTGSAESASFDDSGRMSGFGAPSAGTTIVVQCMTESRRFELDLETLWERILKRNIKENKRARGENVRDEVELEKIVATKLQLPRSGSASQWQALKAASQRRMYHGTPAPRQQSTESEAAPQRDLESLQLLVREVEISMTPFSEEDLCKLLFQIFQAHSSENAVDRMALASELLLTFQERGGKIMSPEILVSLIEALLSSPAYDSFRPEVQKSLELLLTELDTPLDPEQTLRLMQVYAIRQDWEQFWKAFRNPALFSQSRTAEQYELVFRAMVATQDRALCINALRTSYHGMLKEDPAIFPVGDVYLSLKACILMADPEAEQLHKLTLSTDGSVEEALYHAHRIAGREFVMMLKEVEDLRQHVIDMERHRELGREMPQDVLPQDSGHASM